ncbi:MAG: phytanoyl-CoA dioxygenase family protein [Myxococcota bacterium]
MVQALDRTALERLETDGYVVLPGAVPRHLREPAVRRIDRWIAHDMEPSHMPTYLAQSACPEEREHPDFLRVFDQSRLRTVVSNLLGPIGPVRRCQIALRFPESDRMDDRNAVASSLTPHLDGLPTPLNGVSDGSIHHFALLVGIYLEDVPKPWCGNLAVWPGSHWKYADCLRRRGPKSLLLGLPSIQLGPPRQLKGAAGDAFLCHYLLGHSAAPNLSPRIRYALYFRIRHPQHQRLGLGPLVDPWMAWNFA